MASTTVELCIYGGMTMAMEYMKKPLNLNMVIKISNVTPECVITDLTW